MRPALLVADKDDPVAVTLRRRLRTAMVIPAGECFPQAHFTLGEDGALLGGAIAVDGRWVELSALSGVLFRPGRTWRRGRAATTLRQAFNRHERRAAWSAWLTSLPCPVANRLPPAWFLAPDLYRRSLAQSFAAASGLSAAWGQGTSPTPVERTYFVGGAFVSSDAGVKAAGRCLDECAEMVERWCASTGILFGQLDLRRGQHGLEVDTVDPVPSLRRETDAIVERLCRLLASRFA